MCPETITNQYTRSLPSPFSSLWVKYKFKPLQAEIGISVSTVGVRIMPSRSGISDPVSSMGGCRLDNHRV